MFKLFKPYLVCLSIQTLQVHEEYLGSLCLVRCCLLLIVTHKVSSGSGPLHTITVPF